MRRILPRRVPRSWPLPCGSPPLPPSPSADVEIAVGAEGELAAVVVGVGLPLGEHVAPGRGLLAVVGPLGHVGGAGGVGPVQVEPASRGVERHAQEPLLVAAAHLVRQVHDRVARAGAQLAALLGDVEPPVVLAHRERHRPVQLGDLGEAKLPRGHLGRLFLGCLLLGRLPFGRRPWRCGGGRRGGRRRGHGPLRRGGGAGGQGDGEDHHGEAHAAHPSTPDPHTTDPANPPMPGPERWVRATRRRGSAAGVGRGSEFGHAYRTDHGRDRRHRRRLRPAPRRRRLHAGPRRSRREQARRDGRPAAAEIRRLRRGAARRPGRRGRPVTRGGTLP